MMTLLNAQTIAATPGFYPAMSRAQYDSIDAINYSTAKHGIKSMKALRYAMDNKAEASDAMILGNAMHLAILEPQRFADEVALAPTFDQRTKAGKEAAETWVSANVGKLAIGADEMTQIRGMADAINAHPAASWALAQPAQNEVTCIWRDEETGLLCKARLDRVTADGLILDPKSTRDASPSEFCRSIAKFHYHLQAAWYIEGLRKTRGDDAAFAWIAVESSPPHDVCVYDIDPSTLAEGTALMRYLLRSIKKCNESGEWPGISDKINPIAIPAWAMTNAELGV